MNMKKLPWYHTARRWGQTNLTEDDPANCDLEFWKEQWKRTRVQGLIINAGGIVAYYPSKFPLQYRAATLNGKDYFGIWNQAAREAGLHVIARLDINRATDDFYQEHPDWFCLKKDGTPIISQGRYFSCVNSGYYTEYIPAVLGEIYERYQPDGFSDNSWRGMNRDKICYCENCKKKFKKDTGLELPEEPSWEDPNYPAWIRWSYQCRTDVWDMLNRVTKELGGEDCLYFGMFDSDPTNLKGNFADRKAVCARSPAIFCDHQSRDKLNGFEQNSLNGNLLRLASEENINVPESMANYVRGDRAFRIAAGPAEETRTWMAEGFAGGISPWYHQIGGNQYDRRRFETPVPMFQWHEENEKYLYDRVNAANVGVVWSQQNADFYGRDNVRERVTYPWLGMCHALSKARIPFLPINAADIERYASRLQTLILPCIAVLAPEQEQAVIEFVKQGGNLILTGEIATRDRDGNPKAENDLMSYLGLKYTGRTEGVFSKTYENLENYAAHSYMRLPQERHPVLNGFEDTEILGMGGGVHVVESTGDLKKVCIMIEPFPIYPPEFCWIRRDMPDVGTIFAGNAPSGSRVVFFAADIDRCYGYERLPDHAKLLENAVRWAAGDTLPIEVTGIGALDCCVYQQEDRYIVHLVNHSGGDRNPGYCDEIYPVGPITVSLRTGDRSYTAAKLTVNGGEVPAQTKDGITVCTIDKVGMHEMLVFE